MSKLNEGVVMALPKDGRGGVSVSTGTKFYTLDGSEITGVVAFGVPKTGVDEILVVQLTVSLSEIKYE